MPNMFRSEDTDIPMDDGKQEEVISVTASSPEPDAPPTTPTEPIAEVEVTRNGDAEAPLPADVQQYFHMEDEAETPEEDSAPAEEPSEPAPATDETVANIEVETPAAPMDAPAALPAADVVPADAPMAPSAIPAVAPDGTPLTPMATPIADVPAAAPIAPQPETDVAPMIPQVGEDGAPAPIEAPVEAPTAPEEEVVSNEPTQFFRQEEGEPISVVETPEPRDPVNTEVDDEGETVADIIEPIAPVIKQEDEATNDEAAVDGTVPNSADIHDDISTLTPQEIQSDSDVQTEMRQMYRQEGEEGEMGETEENSAGDQNVDVAVHVEGPNVDGEVPAETEVTPEVAQRFRQEGDEPAPLIETLPEVASAPADAPVSDEVINDAVPSPDQAFNSMMMEGGGFL